MCGPGVVFLDEWRVELDLPAPVASRWWYGGIGKKVGKAVKCGEKVGEKMDVYEEEKAVSTWSWSLGALRAFEQRVWQDSTRLMKTYSCF